MLKDNILHLDLASTYGVETMPVLPIKPRLFTCYFDLTKLAHAMGLLTIDNSKPIALRQKTIVGVLPRGIGLTTTRRSMLTILK